MIEIIQKLQNSDKLKKVNNILFDLYLIICIFEFAIARYIPLQFENPRRITVVFGIFLLVFKCLTTKIEFNKNYLVMTIILIVVVISLVFTPYKPTDDTFLKVVSRVMMVAMLYLLNDKKNYKDIFVFFLLVMFFMNISGLIFEWDQLKTFSFRDTRLQGPYIGVNWIGMINIYVVILSVYYFALVKNNAYRILFLIIGLSGLLWIYLSACRGAMVALIATILILIIKKYKKPAVVVLLIFALVIGIYLIVNYRTLFSKSLTREGFSNFEYILNKLSSSRYVIQKQGLYIFSKNLLFGTGVHNISNSACVVLPEIGINIDSKTLCNYSSSHNFIVDSLVETGIVGSAIYFSFLGNKLFRIYHLLDDKKSLLWVSLATAALVYSLFDRQIGHAVFSQGFFFWIAIKRIDSNYKEYRASESVTTAK